MAALEINREHPRKRKERRDSGSSHDRKERRAIERSVSTERCREQNLTPLHDSNRLENERRAERLSRARRPQVTKRIRPVIKTSTSLPRSPKSPKTRKENTSEDSTERSPSPVYQLDLDTLHRQLDSTEPARSWGSWKEDESTLSFAALRTPTSVSHLPGDISHKSISPISERTLDKINKKIGNIKKSLSKHEVEFELRNGKKMAAPDKVTDLDYAKLVEELKCLKLEKKCLKQDPAEYAVRLLAAKKQKEQDEKLELALRSEKPMADLVTDIEEWLSWCRAMGGRNWNVATEKAAVQRALLRLENSRGRPPPNSAARAAARPLYDAYRSVKKALQHQSSGGNELGTILENETMLFPVASQDSSSDDTKATTSEETEKAVVPSQPRVITKEPTPREIKTNPLPKDEEPPSSTSSARSSSEDTPSEEVQRQITESLHCMNIEQLAKILIDTKIHKTQLRKNIKTYEIEHKADNNKALELEYEKYKAVKAKIRLVTALINKKKGAYTSMIK